MTEKGHTITYIGDESMQNTLTLIFMITIGAAIGWTTNILAVKLLFRPIVPVKIPLVNYSLQGLLPKRKAELAYNIGITIEKELISIEEILNKMIEEEDKKNIVAAIKIRVNAVIEEKLPSLIPSSFKNMIKEYIDTVVEEELASMINDLSEDLIHKATARISVGDMVEERINAFEMEKIETIILDIAKKELTHIERLGGVLGALIGALQGAIVILL